MVDKMSLKVELTSKQVEEILDDGLIEHKIKACNTMLELLTSEEQEELAKGVQKELEDWIRLQDVLKDFENK